MNKKHGLTLAETLIALLVIGVVAALTLPNLITTIGEKVKQKQISVVKRKLEQGMSLLGLQNGIGPYYGEEKEGTGLFIKELSKHMKIVNVCDKTNINNCISYNKIAKRDGTTKTLAQYMTDNGIGMGMFDGTSHKYGQVMSIILGDGTIVVFTYDLRCPVADPDSRNENPTSCIHGWFDINGQKGPNRWGSDIFGLNAGFGQMFYPTKPMTYDECIATKDKLGIDYCPKNHANNRWGAIVRDCGGINNVPTLKDLAELASTVYTADGEAIVVGEREAICNEGSSECTDSRTKYKNLTFDAAAKEALGIKSYTILAASTPYAKNSSFMLERIFRNDSSYVGFDGQGNVYFQGICFGEP